MSALDTSRILSLLFLDFSKLLLSMFECDLVALSDELFIVPEITAFSEEESAREERKRFAKKLKTSQLQHRQNVALQQLQTRHHLQNLKTSFSTILRC